MRDGTREVQDLAGERGDLALKAPEELRHQLVHRLRLEGTSKNLERMAHAAIVRSDEALRKEDTETKYPTEEQRSMTEGEQVYTALEFAMNAAGARFFEVPFRPSSYFSSRLTTLTLPIDQLDGRDTIPIGFLLCFGGEATGGEDQPFLGAALHTATEVADQGGLKADVVY